MVTPMSSHRVTITTATETWKDAFQVKQGPAALAPVIALQRRIAARLGLARGIDLQITEVTHEGRGAIMVTPSGETVTVTPA